MITTTSKQDRDFRDSLIDLTLLEQAICWIGDNMEPEDVFETYKLESWAESNDYVKG